MRAVVQRVLSARVEVDGKLTGSTEKGILVYLGVHEDDTDKDLEYICDKVPNLRIFSDSEGKMNLSLLDVKGELLAVSQFTLYGDARRGRRPSYGHAAGNEKGIRYYEAFVENMRKRGITTETGIFGADMQVTYTNDGPVTILLDSFREF